MTEHHNGECRHLFSGRGKMKSGVSRNPDVTAHIGEAVCGFERHLAVAGNYYASPWDTASIVRSEDGIDLG